ncbi:MAG: hypothetical protein J6Q89_02225, partial [Clostridia bacterium]|nr:hypothetical protein [Clostridia bacterium]
MRKLLCVLLSATMLLCVLSVSALALNSGSGAYPISKETIIVDGELSDDGWTADGWVKVNEDNGYWQNDPDTDTLSYMYQLRTDDTRLYGAFVIDCDLVVGGNGVGTNVRIWFRTNDNATVYTHFYDINADKLAAKRNTSLTSNSATAVSNTSLDAQLNGANGVTYVEFSVELAEFGGEERFDYFVVVSNNANKNVALYYPPVPNGSTRLENLPFNNWYTYGDITIKTADIALGDMILDMIPENASGLIPEFIAVDGKLTENGWDINGWTEVNPENGYWLDLPVTDATLSYKYQFRTYGGKLYGAFVVDCALELGENGTGTNARIWLKTKDNATVYTHYYDLNTEAPAAKYNTSLTANSAKDIADTSLVTKISGKGNKTFIEFSVDLDEFGGEDGFDYFVNVSNKDVENVTLYYPAVTVGDYGSRIVNLPYNAWESSKDIHVSVEDIALGNLDFEQHLIGLVGKVNDDAQFDLVVEAPESYVAGEEVTVKVSVKNIVAKDGVDCVSFAFMYDNDKLVLTNDLNEGDNGNLDCIDLSKAGGRWENFSYTTNNFNDIADGEQAVPNNDGVINVAALTTTLYFDSVTEDDVLVFEFTFDVKNDAEGDIALWINNSTAGGMLNTNDAVGVEYYTANGGYAIIAEYTHECEFKLVDGKIACECGEVSDYSGLYENDGVYYCAENGVLLTGWQEIDSAWYYFGEDYAAVSGSVKVDGVWFNFDETGKTEGTWANTLDGKRYYYGPGYYYSGWETIDGNEYYFEGGYPVTGINKLWSGEANKWYNFDETGVCLGTLDGVCEIDGTYYYLEDGIGAEKYLIKVDNDYYFAQYDGILVTDTTMYAWITNCDLPTGTYTFGADGKLVGSKAEGEVVYVGGKYYYYENGVGVEKGLVKVGDDYYFSGFQGELVVNERYFAWMTNCDLPNEWYEFGADGKMLQGIVEKDGVLYYYENGNGVEKGLVYCDGAYYFSGYKGEVIMNERYFAWMTNCDLPMEWYEFGADGKMLQGIIEIDGKNYYYENGNGREKGLVYCDGAYYFTQYKGEVVANERYFAWMTNCDLPMAWYEFGADGKMLQGIVEKDGVLYYYENGNGTEKGLVYCDGAYYFTQFKGEVVRNQEFYAWQTNCDLPTGMYEFGEDGKMLNGIVEKDGELYYYENGRGAEKGLFEYEGG